MQETGLSQYSPYAIESIDEAADAIQNICADYAAAAARRVAIEHLDARHVLRRMLCKLGID